MSHLEGFVRYSESTLKQKPNFENNKYLVENIFSELKRMNLPTPGTFAELESLMENPLAYVQDALFKQASADGPVKFGNIQISKARVLELIEIPPIQKLEQHCANLKSASYKSVLSRYAIFDNGEVSFDEGLFQSDLAATALVTRNNEDKILLEACRSYITSLHALSKIPKRHSEAFEQSYQLLRYISPEDLFEQTRR